MNALAPEAEKDIRDGLIGIVAGAVRSLDFTDDLEYLPEIRENIINTLVDEITSGKVDPTTGAINERARELGEIVSGRINDVKEAIPRYINNYQNATSEGSANWVVNALINNLTTQSLVKLPDGLVKEILDPFFDAIGKDINDYIGESNAFDDGIAKIQETMATRIWNIQNITGRKQEYSGITGGAVIGSTIKELQELGATTSQIEDIIVPFFQELGIVTSDFWNNIRIVYGEDILKIAQEASGVAVGNLFDAAMNSLGSIEKMQDLIDKINKNGLDVDNLEALKSLLGLNFEEIFAQAMEDAENFDVAAILDLLYGKMEEEKENLGDNPFMDIIGMPSETQISDAIKKLTNAKDMDAFMDVWDGLAKNVKDTILESYDGIRELVSDSEAAIEQSANKLSDTMAKIRREADISSRVKSGELWSDMADVLDDIAGGGDKASKAIGDVQERVSQAAMAMAALSEAANGDTEALDYLAKMTNLSAESLGNDLTAAEYAAAQMSLEAGNSVAYLANMLYEAGAIEIDPSGKINAIGSIQAAADAAGMTVAQFAAALLSLDGAYFSLNQKADGSGMYVSAQVKPVSWNSASAKKLSGGRSSGGGGGGGGGSAKVSDAVTNLLDDISAKKAIEDYRRELAQLAQSYYKETGELQGVILYLGIERDLVQENIDTVQGYVDQIEEQIKAKQAIIASEKEGSKGYKQAMLDLEKLQEDHQKYSKELIQNKTDVEALTKAIKEQNDAIRQMEIDLRNTILKAIEDREAAEENMLDGRIEMENEVLELIKKRYEAERDELLETANLKKSALQDEMKQIDDLLNERKKLAEQEDKAKQVAELEAKIARISADPTRQKEAATLRSQLSKLREEMAWDAAEAEADAQKKSIEQQITSLDEYIDYVNNYYEELFKNPEKLIAEMKEVLSGTDDEIIVWLKRNSEDYATATEATQTKMVKNWQETLDKMRDTIRTYWDEVETIIEGGADNILTFLQTYTEEYRKAGKLQAEAYTDEWKKQLDDLEKAHREVVGGINAYNYTTVDTSGSGSGGGGGGSGGSSGGGTTAPSSQGQFTTYQYGYKDASGKWIKLASSVNQTTAFDYAKSMAQNYWKYQKGAGVSEVMKALAAATIANPGTYLKRFARGGLSTSTGLAWLDGTTTQPERILNAYETGLFEDMIDTLHIIRRISTGGILGIPNVSAASALPNIDTINITVEQLNNETDYTEAAEKLMNAFYRKLSRTRPVGGIQGW